MRDFSIITSRSLSYNQTKGVQMSKNKTHFLKIIQNNWTYLSGTGEKYIKL